MGSVDKFIRFSLGIVGGLLVYYNIFSEPWSFLILVVVAVLMLTSITGFCPLYGVMGITSFKRQA